MIKTETPQAAGARPSDARFHGPNHREEMDMSRLNTQMSQSAKIGSGSPRPRGGVKGPGIGNQRPPTRPPIMEDLEEDEDEFDLDDSEFDEEELEMMKMMNDNYKY